VSQRQPDAVGSAVLGMLVSTRNPTLTTWPRLPLTLFSNEEYDLRTLTGHYISGTSRRPQCKSSVNASSQGALLRARASYNQDLRCATAPFGGGSCVALQNRTSICSPRLGRAPHRSLSLCSLPVSKQFGVSLGSAPLAQSPACETWQSAH
jgi:hypothetical protein